MAARVQFATRLQPVHRHARMNLQPSQQLARVIKAMDRAAVTTAAPKLEHERLLLDQDVQNCIAAARAASVP
jgi:hypothetical protein